MNIVLENTFQGLSSFLADVPTYLTSKAFQNITLILLWDRTCLYLPHPKHPVFRNCIAYSSVCLSRKIMKQVTTYALATSLRSKCLTYISSQRSLSSFSLIAMRILTPQSPRRTSSWEARFGEQVVGRHVAPMCDTTAYIPRVSF